MSKQLFIFLAIAVIASSCGKPATAAPTLAPPPTSTPKVQPTDTPLPTVTPVCISSEPTQADIDRALAYTGGTFNTLDWEQSYTVNETTVAVLWQDVPQSALVFLKRVLNHAAMKNLISIRISAMKIGNQSLQIMRATN